MTDQNFKPGDIVVITEYGRPIRATKIRRVLKKYVETEAGSKWNLHGEPYPKGYLSLSRRLQHATPEQMREVRWKELANKLHYLNWEQVDGEKLEAVAAIVLKRKDDDT